MLVLIPEGTIHRKINPSNVTVDTYTLHYPLALLEAYSTPHTDLTQLYGTQAMCIQLPEKDIGEAIALFERCLTVPDDSFGSDLRQNLHFLDILLKFYPLLSAGHGGNNAHSNISPLVSELIRYINQHLSERLTLDRLANTFFFSKYNLCRQFKRETGFTIVEYINSSRIRMACTLLRQEKAISDISSRVGFLNNSHFIHTFRQYTGVTPRNYITRYKTFTDVPFFSNFAPQENGA